MIPAISDRVELNTDAAINERIRRQTDARIAWLAGAGPAALDQRLRELDEEWDIERMVETLAPTLTLTGLALSAVRSKRWLLLPVVVQAFFLQHALQGWCPPIPILRRMGVRTAKEIADERAAAKALRGDYNAAAVAVGSGQGVHDLMDAVRR